MLAAVPSMERRNCFFEFIPMLVFSFLLIFSSVSNAQSFVGVNYGEVADNLPEPEATVTLLKRTTISKLRLYGVDAGMLRALAGSNISVVVGVANGDIANLAASPSAASQWLNSNILPFLPSTTISAIAVGNEVLNSGDPNLASSLISALQNLQSAASAVGGPAAGIKLTTVNIMAVLDQSDPPSSGAFHSDLTQSLTQLLSFLKQTNSPFMINPYPFFAYQSDPRPDTLAFCLFQPNAGRLDAGTNIRYMNMFDAQLDAVKSALGRIGFPDVEIVVAETGWPYRGDVAEAGANIDNARAYVGNLVNHLRSQAGTPLMPGKSVDAYLFALYDEDLKPGPTSERSFGLFHTDMTMTYDCGLMAQGSGAAASSNASSGITGKTTVWCVPTEEATDEELQADLDYACAQSTVDCQPIEKGGACYEPNTVRSHAAYAMNQLYQVSGRNQWNCDFRRTAAIISTDPSYAACVYS